MFVQRRGNYRKSYDARSRSPTSKYSTPNCSINICRIPKRKIYTDVFYKHANLKYKFGNRHFWTERYYVSTVGLNEITMKKYIEEQEKYDMALDKLSVREYEDHFKGM